MWKRVVVCGDYPKYGCLIKGLFGFSHLKPPASLRSLVRHGIRLPFKYASDFIWWLGKNNLSCLRRLPFMLRADAGTKVVLITLYCVYE
jgi:hypothetical protein